MAVPGQKDPAYVILDIVSGTDRTAFYGHHQAPRAC